MHITAEVEEKDFRECLMALFFRNRNRKTKGRQTYGRKTTSPC